MIIRFSKHAAMWLNNREDYRLPFLLFSNLTEKIISLILTCRS